MNANELRKFYEAAPFKPFEMVLPNGSAILVDHPEFMAFSRDFRTVIVTKLNGGAQFIDVKLITSVNVPPQSKVSKKKK